MTAVGAALSVRSNGDAQRAAQGAESSGLTPGVNVQRPGSERPVRNISFLSPPLRPRNGSLLRVLIVARISTIHQDARSLDDQEALCRRWIEDHYDGPVEFEVIATRGSGERLDRAELRQIEDRIASRELDVLITEDLGRIVRRAHAVTICENCEDDGVRLISINDRIDTGQESWRTLAFFQTMHHEMHNADTARRIRRSLRNRFQNGG
ncbi:MAG TPA: recombinase family protein, partial [Lacipirellulaceae bacterium]|nr:recombinase family protein [Lacipirellulaceae bacterium]